jgi:hypothetical protein
VCTLKWHLQGVDTLRMKLAGPPKLASQPLNIGCLLLSSHPPRLIAEVISVRCILRTYLYGLSDGRQS